MTVSHFLIRPFVSDRQFYILSLIASIAILAWYMRPVYHQLSLMISLNAGIDLGKHLIHVPILLVFFGLGYGFRRAVTPFLILVILLAAANVGYTALRIGSPEIRDSGPATARNPNLVRTPSVYILVVDAYQNRRGLLDKSLQRLDIGPTLSRRGFHVYENAFSNYAPTVPSLTSFFETRHHYYRVETEWEDTMTGDNALYAALHSNGYRTVIAHPNKFLLRDHCRSDFCFPTLGLYRQVQFILAETLYHRDDFADTTNVGAEQYREVMRRILAETPKPTVLYSHVLSPNHGPRGCSDTEIPLKIYEKGLHEANDWIEFAIDEIESNDEDAIILVLGDHGAILSDHCEWNNPDTTSARAIVDNLGILMAVKWPGDYDGRYDEKIHTLIDLSWYLLQYLSNDEMQESEKPMSASYLIRKDDHLVYRVVDEGVVQTDSKGYKRKLLRKAER